MRDHGAEGDDRSMPQDKFECRRLEVPETKCRLHPKLGSYFDDEQAVDSVDGDQQCQAAQCQR